MKIDLTVIPKYIGQFGEEVDLEVYSSKTFSDYGDVSTQTTTISSVQAIFNTYGVKQNFVVEGQFLDTTYSFFFKPDQTGVEADNVIVRSDGSRWKINKVMKHALSGGTSVIEAGVRNG